ncbi:Dual specificity protein kinase zakA [Leucoagaricus sp. SymC.cos]|nr:Dual specificity protein kinase zakA [Leucoagaricus sp. SymC.cos]
MRVYTATYKQQDLCVKVVKNEYVEHLKRCMSVFIERTRINHDNIVSFYGVYALAENPMCLVYPWFEWNLAEYIRSNHELSQENRSPLISDIAQGLKHLHELNLIHGKLTCNNVLVSSQGKALLTDIYVRKLHTTATATINVTGAGERGSARWTAPEVLNGQKHTAASDLWSFGCLIYFILSCKEPYHNIKASNRLVREIAVQGGLPARPTEGNDSIDDGAWTATQRFWATDISTRHRPWNNILDDLRAAIPAGFVKNKVVEKFKSSRDFWVETRDSGDVYLDSFDLQQTKSLLGV